MTTSYDPNTRKFSVTDEKPKKAKGKQPYCPRVAIKGELLTTLLGFAKQDNFKLNRKSKNGKVVEDRGKITKTVGMYVNEAIRDFCKARAGK